MPRNLGLAYMGLAVAFMLVAVFQGVRGGGVAVWIALGAVFIALGSAQVAKQKGGDDEPR